MDKADFFNRWAPSYDCLLPSVFYQAVHVRLLEFVDLPAGAQVLEVGCGTGKLLKRLAQTDADLTGSGIDLAGGMIAQAIANNPYPNRLKFLQASVNELPFADATFDGVFCAISFLHYPDPVIALSEMARVLKPNSPIYLADFAPPPWSPTDTVTREVTPGNVRFYQASARERLGQQAGLRCDRHNYLLGPVLLSRFIR